MNFLNIAAYKFINLTELPALRIALKAFAQSCELLGTILLSKEGINIMLAGTPDKINLFKQFLNKYAYFKNLHYKESRSPEQTYRRLLVKVKKEIIAFGKESIQPARQKAPYIKPAELKKLLDHAAENIVLLDTRNHYEIKLGTFEKAVDLNIAHFREFPAAVKKLPPALKNKTIITFCTGGIRCEKAALLLQEEGFTNVYQLEGGILDYFSECKNSHYNGECFVFDRRVAVDAELMPSQHTVQCYACLSPVLLHEQQHPDYHPDKSCPHCYTRAN